MLKKVLICDDEECILETMQVIISREGYEVITAKDGIEVINLAHKEKPDLLILDINMPGRTGYDVCKILKKSPETSSVSIMVLTGSWEVMDFKWEMNTRPDHIMFKPFSPRKMCRKIHEILN